ncbi:uncharacterized protein SOCE26_052780 [Sorangium cellulosum]|uniref:Uncharacterized protein n=1 Tax=Sorangium cellulosum TaxID=56 RepID=A0A2L0EWZ9_SORCE|nr:hypothetical protein [Sorangium cellulosum]AUX43823.1 uncharacterized protein SOCE26_052780 [Sorangium cellulosum]
MSARDRRRVQAAAIQRAVKELTVGLADQGDAAQAYNAANAGESGAAVVRTVADAVRDAAANVRPQGGDARPARPANIPEVMAAGWAQFAGEWRAVYAEMVADDFGQEHGDVQLVAYSERVRAWQDKLRPYLHATAEVRPYDVPPEVPWGRVVAVGVPLLGAGWLALKLASRRRDDDERDEDRRRGRR